MDLAAAGRMCLRRAIKANRCSRIGRVNKLQFRSLVLRGSVLGQWPRRFPDHFSIFFIAVPKNRGGRQITKWNNSISTMALCIEEKNSFFKFLEKGKKLWILAYIFPLLFPKIRYSDDSWSTILFRTQEMEIDELKIWMFTRFSRRNYEMFDRIVSKRFLSMEERSNGLLIF